MKKELKQRINGRQNGHCALSGRSLPKETELFDTDRIKEKVNGGTYRNESNVRAVLPRAHMKRHGNLVDREPGLKEIKMLIDAREQLRKSLYSANNRLLAFERRTDDRDDRTQRFLEWGAGQYEKELSKHDARLAKALEDCDHPMVEIAMAVHGIGPITVAYMLAYVDIEKADSVSSLWKYVGLHAASRERYTKGEKGGGNQTLRTVLYTMAECQMKGQTDPEEKNYKPYREVYERAKAKKEASKAMVLSRNTQGKEVEVSWRDAKPCHRHGHALRMIMKHFLSDWWFAHRTVAGLSTRPLYVEEKLHHTGIIRAEERGWNF